MANESDLQARMAHLLDRQEILDCLTKISRGADRCDRALFLSACHDDAIIAVGPFVGGPSELFDWSSQIAMSTNKGTFHNILNFTCDVDGDTAHTETYYFFVAKNLDDTNLLAGGRYIDRFECRDGAWKLSTRNNLIEWSSVVGALKNPLNDVPGIHANGVSTRGPDDISYTRPLLNLRPRYLPGEC
jgi:hypothetical protein